MVLRHILHQRFLTLAPGPSRLGRIHLHLNTITHPVSRCPGAWSSGPGVVRDTGTGLPVSPVNKGYSISLDKGQHRRQVPILSFVVVP